ncbi:coiled-coil domain-containing protein 82 isoform 2-T2 [Mantella aurantiaca]
MKSTSKMYETRRKRKSSEPMPKSRVDWKRTKVDTISHILDSDESTSTSEVEEEERANGSSISSVESEEQPELSGCTADDGDDQIRKPTHKNRSTTIESSESSSDSEPGLRVLVRRRRTIAEDDDSWNKANEGEPSEEVRAQIKKQKRKDDLKQLVEKKRSKNPRASWESDEASSSSVYIPLTSETMGEDEDSQEMKDFIEEDEEDDEEDQEGEEGNRPSRYQELFLRHRLPQFASNDLYTHLRKVINALLINIADKTFLDTLYEGERKKRYAKDMLKSLNYLDDRVINPRLEKLTASCRWKPRYKWLVVGATCGRRTEVYHRVRHYKFHLYQRCIPFLRISEELSVKETVEMALSKMEKEKFIQDEIELLHTYVDAAETFQDETEESLIS